MLFDQLEKAVDNFQAHTERLRSLATDMPTDTSHYLQNTTRRDFEDTTNPTKVEPAYNPLATKDSSHYAEQPPTTYHFIDGFGRTGSYSGTSMPDHAPEWNHTYESSSMDPGFNQPGEPGEQPLTSVMSNETGPRAKKRKRNKPTLSCKECVDKKIKCDRGRPHCLSCIRRGTDCIYRLKADMNEDNVRQPATRRIYPPKSKGHQTATDQDVSPASSNGPKPALFTHQGGTDLLLSHIPYTMTNSSNIFGVGAEYPFNNYWTQNGGVAEVLKVFPEKQQSDILVNVFFEAVDPVYPLLNRERFYIDYEAFWGLDEERKTEVDIDFLALVFIMLAMGTQFLYSPGSQQQLQGAAEFYSSACHQSLRLFSYLNRTSLRVIQSMVFMTYFLLNSGRASDGWAFSGTLIRQAYATGLNREPTLISSRFTLFERLERRRLWHGVVCQDSFMSMSLRLPPAATHSDIDSAAPLLENDDSIYSIETPESSGDDSFNGPRVSDPGYVQSMYSLALLAQETIATPRSLSLPLANNPRQRNGLLARFRTCYRSFPDEFRAWDEDSIKRLAEKGNKRLVRQIMFLTGLYWYCMTLIQSEVLDEMSNVQQEDGKPTGSSSLESYIRGALDYAYESMRAFFIIHHVLGEEGSVWWAFGHRAFSVSIIVANLLKKHGTSKVPGGSASKSTAASSRRTTALDPLWERARGDVTRMLQLLQGPAKAGDEVARTRIEVLSSYL
ncbi:putative transcriptional regulatory protein PB1A11,04c [Talaromyces islandicus]|uniref:Putative transcriptional regulatory protein PB1A11,04c n=1 Tax=Talaromyces islandicus TaxID=28573 RepID=A0A0U1M4E4_TALIS|nr:putative transcriptional regulatory protein PB1A11,04c [Talaromyces islandicus]